MALIKPTALPILSLLLTFLLTFVVAGPVSGPHDDSGLMGAAVTETKRGLPGGVFNTGGSDNLAARNLPGGVFNTGGNDKVPALDLPLYKKAECTTTFIATTTWETGRTRTEFTTTTTSTQYIPCGNCKLKVVNPGGVGPQISYTTTVTATDPATITTIACSQT